LAVVLNGSPLFTGNAGSGESNIRRWIIENDWLEAIIALPTDMFYNTGIATYIWLITNQKTARQQGKIQLINATDFHSPMRKSLGSKRKQIAPEQIATIIELFEAFTDSEYSKLFDKQAFGYQRITVERPLKLNFQVSAQRIANLKAEKAFARLKPHHQQAILAALELIDTNHLYKNRPAFLKALKHAFKQTGINVKSALFKSIWKALSKQDATADICFDKKGHPEPDSSLRDHENVPLSQTIDTYMQREVLPHVPDAWIDESKTKVGYEIPFNRHFYKYVPPRSLAEIDTELDQISAEIMQLLQEVRV